MEEPSVFERLAERFSECHDEIMNGKTAPDGIEGVIEEAGKALFEAISSKAIQFEDAPTWFDYVPKKKAESGGKRMAWDIYWLNRIYWICVNRREIFPDWPDNSAAELLWTAKFHPDRLVEGSLEKTILNLPSILEARVFSKRARGQRSQEDRIAVKEVCLDLTSLCEDVCLYLAHIPASKSEPAETGKNAKRTLIAIGISLILIFLFVLLVYIVPITWISNHPHRYGIQGSIICLIPCLILGFFKPVWRKWFWGGAFIALLAVLLSLL